MKEVDHYCKWCKHFGTNETHETNERKGFAMCQITPHIRVHACDYCLQFDPSEYAKDHLDSMERTK